MSDAAQTIDDRLDAIEGALAGLLERTASTPTWGRFLSLDDASRYCGLSVKSLRRMLSRREIEPCRPVRGKIVIDRLGLDAAILASAGLVLRRGRGIRS